MAACEGNQGDAGKQESMQELESNLQDLQLGDNGLESVTPGDDALDVVLFNVDGKEGTEQQRRQAIKDVLENDILPKSGQDLFLLCQEVKTIRRDNVIRAAMGMAPRLSEDSTELEDEDEELYVFKQSDAALLGSEELLNLNQDAEIYFRQSPPAYPNPATVSYSVTLLDAGDLLTQAIKYKGDLIAVKDQNDIPRFVARMTVSVLQQRSTSRPMILLVSWHGPWNVNLFDGNRKTAFANLIIFVEKLRGDSTCPIALVGGDFNYRHDEALTTISGFPNDPRTKHLARFNIQLLFAKTPGRPPGNIIDYIVHWPGGELSLSDPVEYFIPEIGPTHLHPFDHATLLFKLKYGPPTPNLEMTKERREFGESEEGKVEALQVQEA
jgi:hypothetical protein